MQQPGKRRVLWQAVGASTVGTVVEWYDFYLYGTAAALVSTRSSFPRFNQIAQTHESFVPLRRNRLDVETQLRQPLRFELPDAIAPIPFAADQACTLQSVKMLHHGLARDTRP